MHSGHASTIYLLVRSKKKINVRSTGFTKYCTSNNNSSLNPAASVHTFFLRKKFPETTY